MATAPGYTVPRTAIEAFIQQAARERGIDPSVAMEVYRREGAGGWQSGVVKNGQRETSYGPFQLYTGGGLGNKFQQQTGLDPADPSTWQQNINFALDEAKKGGWGPWYGAKAAGITGFHGIDGQPSPTMTAQSAAPPPQAPQAAPMSLAPPSMPQQANPLMQAMQVAQLFGSLGGSPQPSQQVALPPPPPPPPRPPPMMPLSMSYEAVRPGRFFYS